MLTAKHRKALRLHQAALIFCLSVYLIGSGNWSRVTWAPGLLALAMFGVLISMLFLLHRAGAVKKRYIALFAAILLGAPLALVLLARHG
jgi:hypothetical protein